MIYNNNRLQFVHCDTLFPTREEAKKYVVGQLDIVARPALYAEPMILKYGNVDSPNILFAIGSVGDGKTSDTKNKTFFIDSSKMEADIQEIYEAEQATNEWVQKLQGFVNSIITSCGLKEDGSYEVVTDDAILKNASSLYMADKMLSEYIQKLEKKTTLNVKEGETLSLELTKEDSGMTLTGEVVIAPNKIVDNNILPNIILHESNGIFTNVDLNYSEAEAQLKLAVNGVEKTLQLPQETHIVKGAYDEKLESLVLTFNREIEMKDEDDEKVNSNKLIIDLGKLIEEWTVLGENENSPIILKREKVSNGQLMANQDEVHGLKAWQDVLSADVRIISKDLIPHNILKKDESGRYLYVDGDAKNIFYAMEGEKEITVKEAIDKVDTRVSKSLGNIIYKREDGVFASTELDYSVAENTLIFKHSTKDGGEKETKIKLNSVSFIDDAYYDNVNELIIINYHDSEGKHKKIEIPVGGLIDEWDVNNDNKTVTLDIAGAENGNRTLSANVNIASGTKDNILEVRGHALYVQGTAENIRVSGDSNVVDEFVSVKKSVADETTRAKDIEASLLGNIHAEEDRAKAAEIILTTNVEKNAKAIAAEEKRATDAEGVLDVKINNEISRATAKDTELDGKTATNKAAIEAEVIRAKGEETAIDSKLDTEIARAKGEEVRIETKLDNEISLSEGNFNGLTTKVETLTSDLLSEANRAKDAEAALNLAIKDEEKRAISAETALSESITDKVKAEETRAIDAETKLSNSIIAETNRATLAETNLGALIGTKEGELKGLVIAETNRAVGAENALNSLIGTTKTDLQELVKAEETRAIDAEKTITNLVGTTKSGLETLITAEGTRAKEVEIVLSGNTTTNAREIADEVSRATIEEKRIADIVSANTEAINAEATRAIAKEGELSQSILDVKAVNSFITTNTGTIVFEKINSPQGSTVSGKVVVATTPEGNLINSDGQALYASVALDYDEASNTLKFKASDGTDKNIVLNAGSLIDLISYDAETEELVISYTDANSGKHEVRFSVRTLFNQWDVADTNPGAVKLTKTIGQGSTHDKLSAEVVIATPQGGNLLENIGGSLYVSNKASDIVLGSGEKVEDAIKNLESGLTQEIEDRTKADEKLQGQITEISGKTKDYDAEFAALKAKDLVHDTEIGRLNTRVDDIKTNDGKQDVKIDALQQDNIAIKDEQKNINLRIDNVEKVNSDQDAAILEANKDIDNLELKTNISAIETLSVKMEFNSTINSSNIKADTKISNDQLNLIVINKASDNIEDGGNGLLFDGSIDYGTY